MTSVLSCYPSSVSTHPGLSELDSSALLQAALITACDHRPPAKQTTRSMVGIANLPEELLSYIVQHNFDVKGLCTLAQVSPRFRQLSVDPTQEKRWEQLYELRFGELTSVVREAARLAKSWKALYRCKLASDKQAEPWMTPCDFELAAMHQRIVGQHSVGEPVGGVVFLLDGSGSVFQDDFQAMTQFVSKTFAELMKSNSASLVGVVQFSTGTRVHLPLDSYTSDAFDQAINDMDRMNGGTNLALAIETAGIMMKEKLLTGSSRTIILLTDGRVDYYQGVETVHTVKRINEEQGNLFVYAFGVGCGVGRADLVKIVSANGCTDADCHYMALAVHPDPDHRW